MTPPLRNSKEPRCNIRLHRCDELASRHLLHIWNTLRLYKAIMGNIVFGAPSLCYSSHYLLQAHCTKHAVMDCPQTYMSYM
jgi:hypothetical protein